MGWLQRLWRPACTALGRWSPGLGSWSRRLAGWTRLWPTRTLDGPQGSDAVWGRRWRLRRSLGWRRFSGASGAGRRRGAAWRGGSAAAATLLAPQAFARLTCHWRRLCPRPCPCLQAKFNFPAANYRKDRKLTKLLQGIETLQDAARSAAAAQGRLCVTSATHPRLPTYPHSAAARSYAQRTIPMKACFPPPLQARPQSAACCARGETP